MYTGNGKYEKTELEKDEAAQRLLHEKEMERALERLHARSVRKKKSFFSALVGVVTGILYILWITFGSEIILPGGESLYGAYISLAGENGFLYALLDFAPPIVLALLLSLISARGERGKFYFVLTALFVLAIVVAVFMLYMSMLAG